MSEQQEWQSQRKIAEIERQRKLNAFEAAMEMVDAGLVERQDAIAGLVGSVALEAATK